MGSPGAWRGRVGCSAVLLLLAAGAAAQEQAATEGPLRTDSRFPYVHRINLYDHDGAVISPDDKPAMPYSPRRTCCKCHAYADIRHGLHFSEPDPNAFPGRPGEPWLLVDRMNGSVIPISGRGWPGTLPPAEVGLTGFQFLKRLGHHFPGGGYGEPDADTRKASPEFARWLVSGPLEIDCMLCHTADGQYDPAEAARQIELENFRWAATAAAGLAVTRGEARKAPDDWDPFMAPDPDRPERSGPTLIYDPRRFDPDGRVLFNITRRVPNERCYYCHTVRQVGEGAPEVWHTEQDVHLVAGLLCVDCHRHGIDHAMTRGFEGESDHPRRQSLTCAGCHLGTADASDRQAAQGGRLRAPYPEHAGFPPLHFEKLTCTACHAGPWPESETKRFQTARAHGLGLSTRDRTDEQLPEIVGPVFARDENGRVAPHRLVRPVVDGQAREPYLWPLAHDVRPASMALGARGCTDCHAADSPVFFGRVVVHAAGGSGAEVLPMSDFHGYDERLASLWAGGFRVRPAFKWLAFVCAVLVGLLVLQVFGDGFNYLVFRVTPATAQPASAAAARSGLTASEHAVHGLAIAGFLIQVLSGNVADFLYGEVAGWALLVHMFGGGLFAVGLTLIALQWAGRCRLGRAGFFTLRQRLLFWIAVILGFAVMLSMLLAMLPWFGTAQQHELVEIHEWSAALLVVVMILHTVEAFTRRKRGTQ